MVLQNKLHRAAVFEDEIIEQPARVPIRAFLVADIARELLNCVVIHDVLLVGAEGGSQQRREVALTPKQCHEVDAQLLTINGILCEEGLEEFVRFVDLKQIKHFGDVRAVDCSNELNHDLVLNRLRQTRFALDHRFTEIKPCFDFHVRL